MSDLQESPKKNLEKLNSLAKTKGFVGKEFLTWLWFVAETQGQGLKLEGASGPLHVDLWIDDRIFLQPFDKMGHDNLLRGGDPSHSQEATASLLSGKVVRELKLGLHLLGLGDFTCILNASDLNPRMLRVPDLADTGEHEAEEGNDRSLTATAALLHRLACVERFCEVLDALFAQFMLRRTQPSWEPETLAQLRSWVAHRQSRQNRTVH